MSSSEGAAPTVGIWLGKDGAFRVSEKPAEGWLVRARMKGRLRFRPNNTGTLATAALTEVTGQSGMACLRGWIELVFEGLHCEAMFHPKLSITYVSGDEAEYVLPPASAESFQVVLYAKEPIASLKLGSAYEPQSFEVRSCHVIPLGRLGVLREILVVCVHPYLSGGVLGAARQKAPSAQPAAAHLEFAGCHQLSRVVGGAGDEMDRRDFTPPRRQANGCNGAAPWRDDGCAAGYTDLARQPVFAA